jgi:glycyl-tRNA synthetase beta chain
MDSRDLLLEIGVEELPSSFVETALTALPELMRKRLAALRLSHGSIRALGTPRRLALLVEGVALQQPDLEQEVQGPPASAAFDKAGGPTRAAEAFARKLGVDMSELRRVATPRGDYLTATRREKGRPTRELLGAELAALCAEIPFRKSMRWGTGEATFGRPARWLVALLGDELIPFSFAGISSDRVTFGHRFLSSGPLSIPAAGAYETLLREAHALVDPAGRRARMVAALHEAARGLDGALIEDEFLFGENLSLVEEPFVVAGSFDPAFLALPEALILEVARGHQRYFGVRGADGKLLPRYLAVVNTALAPDNIIRGNDRVMRARLSDARFFFDEDRKLRLEQRAAKLDGVVFHHRLGSVGAKVKRVIELTRWLGARLGLAETTREDALRGAELAKCDLVSLMVGEFPELQGVMGHAYALAQGERPAVADVIRNHYAPRGAHDAIAPDAPSALVALADRLDTLVGCFAVGLAPTGTADPYALRRACLGLLRTLLGRGWSLSLRELFARAHTSFAGLKLDLSEAECCDKLADFARDRLRGLLAEPFPADVVDACLAVAADDPLDARRRCEALVGLDPAVRARVGQVFKRATNIARDAPDDGLPVDPASLEPEPHVAERVLAAALSSLQDDLDRALASSDYPGAFARIAAFAPGLHEFFASVFVMSDNLDLRNNRLRTMRVVRDTCARVAHVQLLQGGLGPPSAVVAWGRDLMRPGIRLQLVLALGALFALAFVPLYFAVASLTRATLRSERELHARAMGRVVAARVVEAHSSRSRDDLRPLLDAQIAASSGLVGIGVYGREGLLLARSEAPEGASLLPPAVRHGEEALLRSSSRHGPALLVQIPGPEGSVVAALRVDDRIGQGAPLLRLVALYMVLVGSALLLFVYFALTRLVVRPIDDLSSAASRVVAGLRRLDAPSSGAAELIDLGHSLGRMTGRLLENEEALRSKVDALERATAELREAQAQLVRSERLASVGRLSAGLAHEVGNPLAALMGLQDLLLDGGLSPEEERDFLLRMRKETERIHRILRKLLDFARPARPPEAAAPGLLQDAVEETCELLRPQKKMRDVRLILQVSRELPQVRLAQEQLVQIVLNLIDNAADATGGQGTITVRSRLQEGAVLLEVEDDGPGIDPSLLPSLFEPFVSSKPAGEGTGLGLAVCRGLVEEHGGSIHAENLDRGARFTVRLPLA